MPALCRLGPRSGQARQGGTRNAPRAATWNFECFQGSDLDAPSSKSRARVAGGPACRPTAAVTRTMLRPRGCPARRGAAHAVGLACYFECRVSPGLVRETCTRHSLPRPPAASHGGWLACLLYQQILPMDSSIGLSSCICQRRRGAGASNHPWPFRLCQRASLLECRRSFAGCESSGLDP